MRGERGVPAPGGGQSPLWEEPPLPEGEPPSAERRGLSREVRERRYDWEPGATPPTSSEKCGPPGTCPSREPPLVRTLQEPGSRGRGRPTERDGRARGQKRKVRGARDAIPNPKWSWILWILCLWRALQMGAALVLKGRGVLLLRVAVRQLTRSGQLLRETILRQRENQDRQWDPSQDAGGRVQHPPAGPRGALLGRRL